MKGVPFEQAVREFIDWCGEDWYFFTWGNQDVMELQRNMKFYGLLDLLPGPVTYYDVQKLYSISYDDGTHRCALEHAIDELKIEKSRGFHRALADAWYTAKVLEKINNIIKTTRKIPQSELKSIFSTQIAMKILNIFTIHE